MISKITTPKGFKFNKPIKSPFNIDITDLVEPHEGHGTFVTCLNKQKLPLRLPTELVVT